MFKKTITMMVAAVMLVGGLFASAVQAAPGADLRMIPIIVNGQKVKFPDTEPYINTDGRTMVPVRFVTEMLGAEVKWEATTQTVAVFYGSKEISMTIGSRDVTIDGEKVTLDTAAEMYEGRTMVPLRFVSEVMESHVEWDDGAHSVKVTDAAYQAKVNSGEVTLDPWGREYSKTVDANWIKLTDLESTNFYEFFGEMQSRKFIEAKHVSLFKKNADAIGDKIRRWYEVQLNIDYRTISEEMLIKAFLDNASGRITKNEYQKDQTIKVIKEYVKWVKENKVISRGYADPELSTIYSGGDTLVSLPIHFKFMIISAEDSSQTFLDNWEASALSESYELKKGVWYDGYSRVSLSSVVANDTFSEHFGIRRFENMFLRDGHFYRTDEG